MSESNRGMTVLRAVGVSKEVSSPGGSLTIVDNVSLSVPAGDSLAIVGASGSGKSTLLGLLAGLDLPTRGRIELGGDCITELDEDGRAAIRARQLGFVFQAFHLLPGLTALENVMLPIELNSQARPRERARSALDRVGLSARADHYPRQLSGGEQQRVAIARAFATAPRLLFADEPTGNLDNRTGEKIRDLIFEMNEADGTTLVLVTHDERLAERCHHRVALEDGRLLDAGVPA
ncbi:putative ABC transport system ATP-binding protein [Natronospira proteinivora]|uniref:ABC transport system ATP-binding protein n=1 Tax=Natronospira proteinivora TaxID=1807133 RepID=A0ABT1G9L5_9GAMM|nr:ABC transporter ATP-binding protein [Natronospira proteinivora]MCP1727989.1 putative ABC transport system ATP-binding protein [Natronospira proteinivora]